VAKVLRHFGVDQVDCLWSAYIGEDRDVLAEAYFITMGFDVVDDVKTRHCK
jgi:hypothetical protein